MADLNNTSIDINNMGGEAAGAQPAAAAEAPKVNDLDSMVEFVFQGQKYTPEKLAGLFKEREQFAETAKYKDYAENLQVDLDYLLKDPSAIEKFKQIYPKSYHALADSYVKSARPDASQGNAQTTALPKEFLEKINGLESKVSRYERMAHEAEVAKQEAYLQKTVDPLFEKYAFASSDAVYAKAEALIAEGYQMNDAAWDRLVKENHLANEKRFEANHQKKVKEQIEKGNRAQDTGAGGAAPGQAPAKAKSWEEAREQMYRELGVRS